MAIPTGRSRHGRRQLLQTLITVLWGLLVVWLLGVWIGGRTESGTAEPTAGASAGGRGAGPGSLREEEVRLRNGSVRLAGTLAFPASGARPVPALLLYPGAGAQDRDAEFAGHRRYAVLASRLAAAGIATLRLDDRGVGGSSGELLDASFEERAGDVRAAVGFLASRAGVDRARIGALGASEGSLLVALAAAGDPEIDFLVLLSPPGLPGRELLVETHRRNARLRGLPEARIAEAAAAMEQAIGVMLSPAGEADRRRALKPWLRRIERLDPRLAPGALIGRASRRERELEVLLSRNWRDALSHDPRPVLERLARRRVPVLAVFGELDRQVPPDLNRPALDSALAGVPGSEIVVLPGANHLLQPVPPGGTGLPEEYPRIAVAYAEPVYDLLIGWIARRERHEGAPPEAAR